MKSACLFALSLFLIAVVACGGSDDAPVPTEPGYIYTYAGGNSGFNPDAKTVDEMRTRGMGDLVIVGDWLYFVDSENHIVGRINLEDERYETVAGSGEAGTSMPGAGNDIRQVALPNFRSIDVSKDGQTLYLLLIEPGDFNATLFKTDIESGAYEPVITRDSVDQVHVLDEKHVLLKNNAYPLIVVNVETGDSSLFLPGVDVQAVAVENSESVYVASHPDGSIIRFNPETNSSEIIAGPFDASPMLELIRDDVWLLTNPVPRWAWMTVASDGRIGVIDRSRFGHTIGLLDPATGTFKLLAGKGPIDNVGDRILATEAEVSVGSMAFDSDGNMYIPGDNAIRRVNRPLELD